MGRKFIRIPLLMFWPGFSPSYLLKVPIALLRRINVGMIIFLDDILVMAKTLKDIFQAKERLIFLLQNLGFAKNIKKLQLGVSGEFSKHDISLTPGKSFRYPKQMHVTYSVNKDHNYGINQTPRKSLVHCSGSASRENSVQVPATATNSGKFLSNKNKMKPTITGRVEVVEGEFTSSERQIAENRNSTIHHSNGCFRNRLRGNLSGNHHGGNLFISAKDKTYQCTGAHCSETCKFNLCQGKIGNNNPFTN